MGMTPHLTRSANGELAWLSDDRRPGGVTLAFSERTGGCSSAPYASLNLGDACGDDGEVVAENRRLLLEALGCAGLQERLVNPVQVHGDRVIVVSDASPETVLEAQRQAREGADAIVCSAYDVPVLLCFADCVPVVLVAEGAFAVAHSGWKGTKARIAGKALEELCHLSGCRPHEVWAYIGPHIGGADYEVSEELAGTFAQDFGDDVLVGERHLDLGAAVRKTLCEAGVLPELISDECPSTASCTSRFYSYRAEAGACGRHGALAVLSSSHEEVA